MKWLFLLVDALTYLGFVAFLSLVVLTTAFPWR